MGECFAKGLFKPFVFPYLYFRRFSNAGFIFGEHPTKPNRCALMAFNTKREETLIAETDYRIFCSTACINGELISELSIRVASFSLQFFFCENVYIELNNDFLTRI